MKNIFLIVSILIALTECNNSKSKKKAEVKPLDKKSVSAEVSPSKIDVSLNFKHFTKQRELFFEIETNLPDNFMGNMTITNSKGEIMGQSKFYVESGSILSTGFSSKGKPYSKGKYNLSVSSPYPHLQDDETVKKLIGKTGEYLVGKGIVRRTDDIMNDTYSFLKADYKFVIDESSYASSNVLGVWVLRKGGGNDNEYSIQKVGKGLKLITKVMSPHMSEPFITESKLIKIKGKYIREDEKENPDYYFEIKNENLIIYDSFGVYANLENEY